MDKKESRLRRGRQTRIKIAQLGVNRLSVHRTNLHIYANLISPDAKVLVSASTLEARPARAATLKPLPWLASASQRKH
jgi:large subunit ribosomal protein L18